MLHRAYDLGRLAASLRRVNRYKPLVQAIQDVIDLHSAHTDLIHARDAGSELQSLQQHLPAIRDGHNAITNALMSHMIILYVRATKTTQSARKTFDIRPRMSPEERDFHKQVCDLRDKAVAHFGNGGSYDGTSLVRETAYMKPVPGDMKFGVVTRRIMQDPQLTARLVEQIGVAIGIFDAIKGKKQDAVVNMLVAHMEDSDELVATLNRHPFDAEAFLGSQEEAAAFYEAPIMEIRRGNPIIDRDNGKWLPDRET